MRVRGVCVWGGVRIVTTGVRLQGQRSEVSRYLCVGLLLLLLVDQSLQSLHRVRGDAEVRGQLLLEAVHPG